MVKSGTAKKREKNTVQYTHVRWKLTSRETVDEIKMSKQQPGQEKTKENKREIMNNDHSVCTVLLRIKCLTRRDKKRKTKGIKIKRII